MKTFRSEPREPTAEDMLGTARITSDEDWHHGWLRDYALAVAVFTATIPLQVLDLSARTTGSIAEPLAVVAELALYAVSFALVVLAVAAIDGRIWRRLPAVETRTPNFRGVLLPATVVVSWFLVLAVGELVFDGLDSELVAAVLWGVVGNGLAFCGCAVLATVYGRRED